MYITGVARESLHQLVLGRRKESSDDEVSDGQDENRK